MKHLHKAFALFLVFAFFLPITVYGAENESGQKSSEYEGYLISITDGTVPDTDDLEEIAPDVYLTEDKALVNALLENGVAECAEPNYSVSLFDLEEDMTWSYQAVGGPEAAYYGLDGSGVRIAVIDSGVDKSNANLTGANFAAAYDYLNSTEEITDDVGHGTFVCQILAGSGNSGVLGIARGAELVPLKCFSSYEGSVSSIISAVYNAVDVYHCDIINMSWGMQEKSLFLETALQYAYQAGAILVSAAGNVTTQNPQGTIIYPAAYPEVIGVGSVDNTLTVAHTSQCTKAVTVCAPGESIAVSSLSGFPVTCSGTSFACPYVAAELALLKQLIPEINNDTAFSLLRERAIDLGEAGYDTSYGYGFVRFTELLGQGYSILCETDNGVLVSGWMKNIGGGSIIAASYNQSGEMLACTVQTVQNDLEPFEISPAAGEDVKEIRLFYSDFNCIPVTAKQVFSIEN